MSTNNLDAVITQLEELRTSYVLRTQTLRSELSEDEKHLSHVEAALAALSGSPLSPPGTAATKKERKKAVAPSATKALVIELISQELTQADSLPESELKSRVEDKLVEAGHSRNGYSLRFKEAVADAKFHKNANGVSLNASPVRLPS